MGKKREIQLRKVERQQFASFMFLFSSICIGAPAEEASERNITLLYTNAYHHPIRSLIFLCANALLSLHASICTEGAWLEHALNMSIQIERYTQTQQRRRRHQHHHRRRRCRHHHPHHRIEKQKMQQQHTANQNNFD